MSGLDAKLPLSYDEEDGFYKLNKKYSEMIRQDLKNLLLTAPGERVMDPVFGVGLRRYLFEPNSAVTYSQVKSRISQQVKKYMSFLRLDQVLITDFDGNKVPQDSQIMSVKISYTVVPLDYQDILQLNIDSRTT